MLPAHTFQSWGSSSSLVLRRKRPVRVIRGSSSLVNGTPRLSALTTMDRNFQMRNGFPALHVGRVWFDWWLFPIPNSQSIWPQFRSPLMWDVFAVSTYFTVSVLFWYMGLIPDVAVMRDRAKTKPRQFIYGLLALGWTGSNRHWSNYEKAYLILAGLATPLVLSVHSIRSLDFAVSQLPGWHTTLFPPYFVAGAVYSGFGMVLTLLIPLRKLCHLEDIITMRLIDVMCKVTLATSSIVGYAYFMEFFIAWYSGNPMERFHFRSEE